MQILNQRDPSWGGIKLGFSDTYIKDYGCTITCIAMIVGVTPNIVNDRMKAVNGFASGNLVIWAKIEEAFPGIKIRRVWSYDNADVKANTPNVMVEVPAAPIGGTGSHWVVYLGNARLNDPWTGNERPTFDFPNPTGYCVLTGSYKNPEATTVPMAIITQAELDEIRNARDQHYNDLQIKIKEVDQLTKDINSCETQAGQYLDQLSKLNDEDKSTSEQLLTAQHAFQPLQDEITAIKKELVIQDDSQIIPTIQTIKSSKVKPFPMPKTLSGRISLAMKILSGK